MKKGPLTQLARLAEWGDLERITIRESENVLV